MTFLMESMANLFDALMGTFFVLKMNKGSIRENKHCWIAALLSFSVSTFFLFVSDFTLMHTVLDTAIFLVFAFSVKPHTAFTAVISTIIFELSIAFSSTMVFVTLASLFQVDISLLASGFTFRRCLLLILCKSLIAAVLLPIMRFYHPGKSFKALDMSLYLLSPIMTEIVLYTFLSMSLKENLEPYYVLMFIASAGLILANALTLLLFTRYTKNQQETYEMQMMLHLSQAEQQKYAETQKAYESLRILKHDLKEQLGYANELFRKGEFKEAESHIAEIETSITDAGNLIHTGNRIIDSILYSKINAHPEIRFIVSGTMEKLDYIGDMETVSIFSNMLENAIEETVKNDEKIIELTFSLIGDFQNISCKNPLREPKLKQNPSLQTTKANKELHGFGIKSMRKAVEALNGFLEFYEKDGYFICHIAFPIGSPAV